MKFKIVSQLYIVYRLFYNFYPLHRLSQVWSNTFIKKIYRTLKLICFISEYSFRLDIECFYYLTWDILMDDNFICVTSKWLYFFLVSFFVVEGLQKRIFFKYLVCHLFQTIISVVDFSREFHIELFTGFQLEIYHSNCCLEIM